MISTCRSYFLAFFFAILGCLHFLFSLLTQERRVMLVVSDDVAC